MQDKIFERKFLSFQWFKLENFSALVRMSQDDPLNPSSTKNYQVDSENNNQGESNMIKEKIIKNP